MSNETERLAAELESWADDADLHGMHNVPVTPKTLRTVAALLRSQQAAQVCDTTPPEPFRPSIEAAHALRQMAEGLKP
jgi:hypothetical protein